MNGRDILIYLSIKYGGDWDKIVTSIRSHEDFKTEDALKAIKKLSCNTVTLVDADYPQSLKNAPKPPLVLFYYGNLSLVDDLKTCISYIGSRKATSYGLKMADEICSGLASSGFSIISGLAKGVDAASAKAALPFHRAVEILGNGIDYYYPPENSNLQREVKEKGLLMSEYPPNCPPKAEHFPARNRIIAALSQLTIVGEASSRSGTLITVGHALSIGRDVACLPFHADENSACNALIKDGAPIVESVKDVFDVLGYSKYLENDDENKNSKPL